MTKRNKETMIMRRKNKFEDRYAKGIHFDVRTKGSCYVNMKTRAGKLTVYIDSMDGLTDPPLVSAWIFGRKRKEIFVKGNNELKK